MLVHKLLLPTRFFRAATIALPLLLVIVALASMTASAQQKPAIAGEYAGILGPLHLRLHLKVDAAGAVSGTLDSTDQGATGIPCADFHLYGQALTFSVPAVHGTWKGTISADGAALTGTWDQGAPQP